LHRRGWQPEEFDLYGEKVRKMLKTFRATYRPAGGLSGNLPAREMGSVV
jgi:hypothetical protein